MENNRATRKLSRGRRKDKGRDKRAGAGERRGAGCLSPGGKRFSPKCQVILAVRKDFLTKHSYFRFANLAFTNIVPSYDFFNPDAPIYTHARFLPASKINHARVDRSIISDGCIITNATIEHCLVGVRSVIDGGTTIRDCIIMGADYFERDNPPDGVPRIGIGRECRIERAIIDKNARIGDRVHISPAGKPENLDGPNYCIRDGIVVIPKDSIIPSDTWI